jgi:hypothetical protein
VLRAGIRDWFRDGFFRTVGEVDGGVPPRLLALLEELLGGDLVADRPTLRSCVVKGSPWGCCGDVRPQSAPPKVVDGEPVAEEVSVQGVSQVTGRRRGQPRYFPGVNPSSPSPRLVPSEDQALNMSFNGSVPGSAVKLSKTT